MKRDREKIENMKKKKIEAERMHTTENILLGKRVLGVNGIFKGEKYPGSIIVIESIPKCQNKMKSSQEEKNRFEMCFHNFQSEKYTLCRL